VASVRTTIIAAVLACVVPAAIRAQVSNLSEAPVAIQELSASLQGKPRSEVRGTIVARLGEPQRNIGSGFLIEQWDMPSGVLTFHQATGPSFVDSKSRRIFRPLKTTNPVASNLLSRYDMLTSPDPKNHGNQFWLGTVEITAALTYRYVDSRQFPAQRAAQAENFFMLHPAGTVEISYRAPVTAETCLETIPDHATVATVTFISAERAHRAVFSVVSTEPSRQLTFVADGALTFRLAKSWDNFWQ